MLKTDYLVLGLAGLAVWFILKGKAAGGAGNTAGGSAAWVSKAAPDYMGWQYFTDGTAIGPDGSYYHNGVKVWSRAA